MEEEVLYGLAPFALAIVAATVANEIPVGLVYILTCIGTFIGFGGHGLLSYVITTIVFFISIHLFKTKIQGDCNERKKLSKHIIIATLIVQIAPIAFGTFYVYDFLVAIMQAIVALIFYKIFVNSITVVRDYNLKSVFSIEEVIGACLMFAIAFSSLTQVFVFGFSVRNILCILVVLILGWKNGMMVGATGGITMGVVLGIVNSGDPILIAAFAISGLLAGLLNRFGKPGVIIGFVLGNTLLTYVSNGNVVPVIVFQEILIASLGLLVLPKKVEFKIEDILNSTKLLPETTSRALEGSKETVRKLANISETISEMARSYTETAATVVDEELTKIEEENKQIFINELYANIDSIKDNVLYEDIANSEEIAGDIFKCLLINSIMTNKKLIEIFENHNSYIVGFSKDNEPEANKQMDNDISEMVKKINYSYKMSKINFTYRKKIQENKKNASEQLKGVSQIISELATDIEHSQDNKEFQAEKEQIIELLKQKQIKVDEINIKREESGKYNVAVHLACCSDINGDLCEVKAIGQIVSRVLDEKMVLSKQICGLRKNQDGCVFTYMSKDKYKLQVGIAKSTKQGSPVSGDTSIQTKLDDGKYLLAISDGMGSGPEARKSSKIAIKMLERLLTSGFRKDTSIKLINSSLAANMQDDDMYATLDIAVLDLYAENMEFVKNGACPTYIKRNKDVQLLKCISMPTGILDDVDLIVYDKDIQKGDIIVMCSDGIIESNTEYQNKELWLKYLLEEMVSDDVQKMADIIISEAIDNDFGKEKDDMTVIVAKIC